MSTPADDQGLLLVELADGETRYEQWDGPASPAFDMSGARSIRVLKMPTERPPPKVVRVLGFSMHVTVGDDGEMKVDDIGIEASEIEVGREIILYDSLRQKLVGILAGVAQHLRNGGNMQAKAPR